MTPWDLKAYPLTPWDLVGLPLPMFLQFCPLQVAEGENHTLIERRDELNATMMEQVTCHHEYHHDHHNDEAGLHQGDG